MFGSNAAGVSDDEASAGVVSVAGAG
ncbi:MAG: hypothetical protein JWR58_949, partial [Pseudonocardia sp.]|nr:hypothetical protein [Pseudonocardia sp.]